MTVLGIDTSNYTTSLALVRDKEVVRTLKKSVYVGEHERGARQSDALFCHVKNLPELFEELGPIEDLSAIGYSAKPRDAEGSYMPCFLPGQTVARALGASAGVPVYAFSHQAGHIRAALYGAQALHIKDGRFLAFHVSGGTTELLLCEKDAIGKVGGTKDLTAGQLVDRIGVALGLAFPCGAEMEKLARGVKPERHGVSVDGTWCCLSGAENLARQRIARGDSPAQTAAFTIEMVRRTLAAMTENAFSVYGRLPVLYAGGVMSCSLIREDFTARYGGYFAPAVFSADNAAGTALLAEERFLASGAQKTE